MQVMLVNNQSICRPLFYLSIYISYSQWILTNEYILYIDNSIPLQVGTYKQFFQAFKNNKKRSDAFLQHHTDAYCYISHYNIFMYFGFIILCYITVKWITADRSHTRLANINYCTLFLIIFSSLRFFGQASVDSFTWSYNITDRRLKSIDC